MTNTIFKNTVIDKRDEGLVATKIAKGWGKLYTIDYHMLSYEAVIALYQLWGWPFEEVDILRHQPPETVTVTVELDSTAGEKLGFRDLSRFTSDDKTYLYAAQLRKRLIEQEILPDGHGLGDHWAFRKRRMTLLENGKVPFPKDWAERLNRELVIETERAIKQRDVFLATGVSTASQGGSHDTCFELIIAKFMDELK